MNDHQEFKTFLNLGSENFLITVFDQNNNKIYEDKFFKEKNINEINDDELLNNFLDKNIFKIEKLTDNYIKKINLVIDKDIFTSTQVSIKQKSYGKKITFFEMKQMLSEIRELIKENNSDHSVIHMLIENYVINGQTHKNLDIELNCDDLILEIQFVCLTHKFVKSLNDKFKSYQIEIRQIFAGSYVRNFTNRLDLSINEMAFKIMNGENLNEVKIISKNPTKKGFFEKFFNLFS
tara:strand:+ start:1219 stop:1923 length:705 start_codon:yes stop_codon:yes gene_type:complete